MTHERHIPPLSPSRGFTLLEALVALAITAAALSTGLRASGLLIASAERQQQSLLARLCAQNALADLRAKEGRAPAHAESTCSQAGRTIKIAIDATPTPNAHLRRLDIEASEDGSRLYRLTALATEP